MKFTTGSITNEINKNFGTAYASQRWFIESGTVWNDCMNTVLDAELMNHIIFCNDVLEIPPVKTFLKADINISSVTEKRDKQAIGAFWGFVFKFVFHYQNQLEDVHIDTKGVSKATVFYNCETNPVVIKG